MYYCKIKMAWHITETSERDCFPVPLRCYGCLTSSVPWFQSNPDRESAFRGYRGDSATDDNTAHHLDSIGKWNIRYSQFYESSDFTAMQVEQLKDTADLVLPLVFIDSGPTEKIRRRFKHVGKERLQKFFSYLYHACLSSCNHSRNAGPLFTTFSVREFY
jgi:hypothetical protein